MLILAIGVFSSQIAFGQYEDGVPPVYLPKATNSLKKTVSGLKSDNLTQATTANTDETATEGSVVVGADDNVGSCCCGDSSCCQQGCGVGRSFFGNRCGSGCAGAGRIKFSINRGSSSTCNQCGCDNRTFLQRILPISINIQSNHESRYVGIFGGYHDMQDIRATDRLLEFDESFIFGFTRGRRFCDRIRMEAEFAIRDAPAGEYFEGMFAGEDFVPSATYDGEDGLYRIFVDAKRTDRLQRCRNPAQAIRWCGTGRHLCHRRLYQR